MKPSWTRLASDLQPWVILEQETLEWLTGESHQECTATSGCQSELSKSTLGRGLPAHPMGWTKQNSRVLNVLFELKATLKQNRRCQQVP